MRNFFATVVFACVVILPASAWSYVLNGLDYTINDQYEFMTYQQIVDSLEGTGRRLATTQEIIDLFENFGIYNNRISVDQAWMQEFTKDFHFTYGLGGTYQGCLGTSDGYRDNNCIIIGRLQEEDGRTPAALVSITSWTTRDETGEYHWEIRVQGSFYGTFSLDYPTGHPEGISAWIVTPVADPVPEPTTALLFGVGLIGVCVVSRKRN